LSHEFARSPRTWSLLGCVPRMCHGACKPVYENKKERVSSSAAIEREEQQLLSFHSPHFVLPGVRFQLPLFLDSSSMIPTSSVSFFQVGFSSVSTLCFLLLPMLTVFFYLFPDTALPPHPFFVPPFFSCFSSPR
jgi:hypothetical protein